VLAELEVHRTPFASVVWLNDATIACVGAHRGRDGGIVIAGTGSVGLALQDGREIRVGGYGFPISDEGSGADLGLRAIRAGLRAHDGRMAATKLTRSVMARFGGDPFEAVAFADCATATDYAKFAPLVMDHAEAGDPVACTIVAHAAEEIESLATRLAARGVRRIALLGGLGSRLTAWLSPDSQRLFVPAQGDAIDGALNLARRFAAGSRFPAAQA
jgi:glucosamine kinase